MSRIEFLRGDLRTPPDEPPPPFDPSSGRSTEPEPLSPPPVPSARRGRGRLGPRSLTARIVSGVVLVVLLVVVSVGVGTYFTLRSSLEQRLNEQVASAASQNASYFSRCRGEIASASLYCPPTSGPATGMEWVALLNPSNGGVLIQIKTDKGPLVPLTLSAAKRAALAADPTQTFDVTQDGHRLRVTGRTNAIGLLVVTGLPTSEVDGTLSRLVAREVIIGAAAILIAILATSYGVQFSLRKLRRVTTTAQDVALELSPEGAGLDRRVPDDEPDTEVGQLATSFNTMLAAVETQFAARIESERRMRQFLADASHELRTPLTSIRGYAELARMQRAVGDASDDNLDRIESEGTRMSRLVEDLLLLARGDTDGSTRTRHELVDVDVLIDDAVSGSRAAFPERTILTEVQGTPQVIGDPDQLLRVIRNLITNAAVHTEPDRPVTVRGWRDASGVVVQVVDQGPGLPPDEAAHVFERFWRADKARTRARGGSGLGLAIVATIVRAHGGSVRFDSAVETGSIVTIVLPAVD